MHEPNDQDDWVIPRSVDLPGSWLWRTAVTIRRWIRPARRRWAHWRAQWFGFWDVW